MLLIFSICVLLCLGKTSGNSEEKAFINGANMHAKEMEAQLSSSIQQFNLNNQKKAPTTVKKRTIQKAPQNEGAYVVYKGYRTGESRENCMRGKNYDVMAVARSGECINIARDDGDEEDEEEVERRGDFRRKLAKAFFRTEVQSIREDDYDYVPEFYSFKVMCSETEDVEVVYFLDHNCDEAKFYKRFEFPENNCKDRALIEYETFQCKYESNPLDAMDPRFKNRIVDVNGPNPGESSYIFGEKRLWLGDYLEKFGRTTCKKYHYRNEKGKKKKGYFKMMCAGNKRMKFLYFKNWKRCRKQGAKNHADHVRIEYVDSFEPMKEEGSPYWHQFICYGKDHVNCNADVCRVEYSL